MPQTYTEIVSSHIKRFKQNIAGTTVKATTIRQAYNGYFLRFSDGTVCDIRIRQGEHRINIDPMHGGPKKSVSAVDVSESIIESDPERAADLLEQKLGEWLASSEQDVFHAVQCHNQGSLLEKINQRIKSAGLKSTSLVNDTLLANMFSHGLIKKDSANCYILPEMTKDRFFELLEHAARQTLANVNEQASLGYAIEVEAGGRKYPIQILGYEFISAKELPKSRHGEIISRVQHYIDKKNNEPKCSKCGNTYGYVTWSPFENDKRTFKCDKCNTATEMTRRARLVTKFSEGNINSSGTSVAKKIPEEKLRDNWSLIEITGNYAYEIPDNTRTLMVNRDQWVIFGKSKVNGKWLDIPFIELSKKNYTLKQAMVEAEVSCERNDEYKSAISNILPDSSSLIIKYLESITVEARS